MIDAVLLDKTGKDLLSVKIDEITEKIYLPDSDKASSSKPKSKAYRLIGVVQTQIQIPYYVEEKEEDNGNE